MTDLDTSPVPDFPGLLRLDGRTVVILGAGQGIGRQATHAAVACGATVVAVDVELERVAHVAAEAGPAVHPWAGNVIDREEMRRLVADTEQAHGRIDSLIDIIGMASYSNILETTEDDWSWHFDICLRHAWLAVQEVGRSMADHGGGAMAFVASVSGLTSAPSHAAYGAAKAGLMSLVRTAAVELGPQAIRVNAVAPGVVWTPRVSAFLGEEGRAVNEANAPLRTVSEPRDIASALLFMVSDLARCVTGQTLTVDCGVGAKFPYPMPE